MARDSSGNYSLPGSAFVTGQTASATDVNTKLSDLAAEMQDSLSRSGKGGMSQPFRTVDGTVSGPGFSYTQETGTGLYRVSAGVLGMAILGVQVARASASGLHALAYGVLTATSAILRGAVADGASAVGVILDNSVTLANAAAKIASFRNNGSEVAAVALDGDVLTPEVRAIGATGLTLKGAVADGVGANAVTITHSTALANATANALSVTASDGTALFWVRGSNTGLGIGTSGPVTADYIQANGGGTGGVDAGGYFTPGGVSPSRGAINLSPQATPSAPQNGDIWVDTGDNTLKVRINGVTRTVTVT